MIPTFPIIPQVKVYNALLSQSGTNAPTVTSILKNTLGTIIWTRVNEGIYRGELTGAFSNPLKLSMQIKNNWSGLCGYAIYVNDDNSVEINTTSYGLGDFVNSDNMMGNSNVIIEVYQ